MSEPAVHARGLVKRFGKVTAVDGVDLDIPRGVCFGFLGPNGAGKTTTMRMVYRASRVDGGELSVLGLPVQRGAGDREIKRRIGVVPQEDSLDQELTVRQNLLVFARFYGTPRAEAERRAEELIDLVDLREKADAKVIALSGGMKRRALIARGLVGDPELLVLDEPTTGLDPHARQALWRLLHQLRLQERTLLLTTHYMEEAERLCDDLVVMDRGRVVARGAPQSLIDEHVPPHVLEVRLERGEVPACLDGLEAQADRAERLADRALLYTKDLEALAARAAHELPDHRVLSRRANLEDVFLRITGHGLGDG